ncbi:MAG: phosphotransacetylase family protein [Anaerolineales bacterium]|nr:phosphotransacetylase family protein [Anaerolineales bacterium]
MKALYVTSLHTSSGKTALCLGLARRMQAEGRKVGYFKPLSVQAWTPGKFQTDEDADFVRRILDLSEDVRDLVGVMLAPDTVKHLVATEPNTALLDQVKASFGKVSQGKDVMLLEGGGSLREGYCVGLGTPVVAEALGAPALAIAPYRNRLSLLDDCLVAQLRLGKQLLGVVVNQLPDEETAFFDEVARPYLKRHGIPLLGVLPNRERLEAISVEELADALQAEYLTLPEKRDVLIENMIVGAMGVQHALPHLRHVAGSKAVITGGDRADIQLVALETGSCCLVLTGHLRPVPEVLRRAEESEVPILLVRQNTLETVQLVEQVFGKTRLGQAAKLQEFESLLEGHFDFARLYEALGL